MFYPSKRFSLILFYVILYVQTVLTNDSTYSSLGTDVSQSTVMMESLSTDVFTGTSVSGEVTTLLNSVVTTAGLPTTSATDGQGNSVATTIGETGTHSTPVSQTAQSENPTTIVTGTNTNPTSGGNGNTATDTFASVSLNTGNTATDKTNDPSATPSHTGSPSNTHDTATDKTNNPSATPSHTGSPSNTHDTATDKTNNPSATPSHTDATGVTSVTPGISTPTSTLPQKTKQYTFIISTNESLSSNQADVNVLNSMTEEVKVLFNTSSVNVKVTKITISQSKAMETKNYTVLLDILLTSITLSCDESCIDKSRISSELKSIQLLLENGKLAAIPVVSKVDEVTETTPAPPRIGESSPGLAARLGMGLGISFLGVLLIGEIAFFVWKFNSNKSHRSAAYASTT